MKVIEINDNIIQSLNVITDAALKFGGNQIRPAVNFIENSIKDIEINTPTLDKE